MTKYLIFGIIPSQTTNQKKFHEEGWLFRKRNFYIMKLFLKMNNRDYKFKI